MTQLSRVGLVNALYKSELIYGPDQGPWRTVEDVELATRGCTGTTPRGYTATYATCHPQSSKLRSTLRPRPPARQLESNNPSLHQTQCGSLRSGRVNMAEPSTRWDVYRDRMGAAVIVPESLCERPRGLTREQLTAVRHAVKVWIDVRESTAPGSSYDSRDVTWGIDMVKSRLLGRMIHEGKRPHDFPPPLRYGGGWWEVIEDGYALLSGDEVSIASSAESTIYIDRGPWLVDAHRVLDSLTDRFDLTRCDRNGRQVAPGERWVLHRTSDRVSAAALAGHLASEAPRPREWLERSGPWSQLERTGS